MVIETRKVLSGVSLTKEEANTLWEAQKIIQEAIFNVLEFKDNCGEIDVDVLEKLNTCMDGMNECYPRINVSTTCGKDYYTGHSR